MLCSQVQWSVSILSNRYNYIVQQDCRPFYLLPYLLHQNQLHVVVIDEQHWNDHGAQLHVVECLHPIHESIYIHVPVLLFFQLIYLIYCIRISSMLKQLTGKIIITKACSNMQWSVSILISSIYNNYHSWCTTHFITTVHISSIIYNFVKYSRHSISSCLHQLLVLI